LRAAELSPGSPEIHFHLLRAYARKNLPEKAATERAVFVAAECAGRATAQRHGFAVVWRGSSARWSFGGRSGFAANISKQFSAAMSFC
jgi:hypothetical protein